MKAKEILAERLIGKTMIDLLIEVNPEIDKTCRQLYEMEKLQVEGAMRVRFSKEEKNEYLDKLIIAKRDYLEKTNSIVLYNSMASYSDQTLENSGKIFEGVSQMLGMIPSEHHATLSTENISLLRQMATGNNAENLDIKQAEIVLNQFGTLIPSIQTASHTDNPIETFLKFFVYLHYEIKCLEYLNEIKVQVNAIAQLNETLQKIEWIGDQKKLAELFIELQRKGWIKEINGNLIKAYFTNSDTIQEPLKGDTYDKDGRPLYTKLFTKAYVKAFELMKYNTQKTK